MTGEGATNSNDAGRFTSSSQFSIPNLTNFVSMKLNGENYLCWKYQLLTVLKTLGLQKHVDLSTVPPLAPAEAVERWQKENNFVSACINSTLDPSVAHLAIDTESAADLWKVIEDSYLQQAFAKRSQLKTQFQTTKQVSNSVSVYCDSMKKICDSLKAIGEKISEADLVLQILHGLNSNYNMFVLNIENSDSQPNFAQLRSRLLMYEERINQQSETIPISAMSALKLGDPPPHGFSKEIVTEISCQICQKHGHTADKCFFRYNDRSIGGFGSGNRRNSGGRNQFQNRVGSNSWRGQSYFRGNRGGRSGANRGSFDGHFNHAYTADFGQFGPAHFAKWAAQHGTCSLVDSWIPDSGATTHMTSNPNLVQGAVAYTGPERVIVGQSVFGNPTPVFGAAAATSPNNNDQMSMEDSMDEDSMLIPTPVSQFGQAPAAAPGFMFGSATPNPTPTPAALPFQFGGQPNQAPAQNPFQSSSVEFNAGGGSFSLGSGGNKSRRIVRVKIKNRRK